jgi:hypothetical protein
LKAGGVEPPSHMGTRMKLHGNAALCLSQRRRLARRVVEEK